MSHSRFGAVKKRLSLLLSALLVAEIILPGLAFALPPAFTATQTVANAAVIQQVESLNVPRTLVTGDTVSLSVSGTTVSQNFQISHAATLNALASLASGIPNVTATFDSVNNRLVFGISSANPTPVSLTLNRSPVSPTIAVANVVAVAQVARVDVPQFLIPGDVLSLSVDGSGVSVAYSGSDAGTLTALNASLEALPQVSAALSLTGRYVTLTAATPGVAFGISNLTVDSSPVSVNGVHANVFPVAQVETLTLARPLYSGDVVALSLSGVNLSQSFTGDTATTMAALANQADQLASVNAGYSVGVLTVTAATPGVPFAISNLTVSGSALPAINVTPNNVAVAQRDAVILPRQTVAGDTVHLDMNGTNLSSTFSGSHAATMSGLISQIDGLGTVSATFNPLLNVLTIDSTVPGTPFTVQWARVTSSVASVQTTANVSAVAQVDSLTFGRDFVAGDQISVVANGNTLSSTFSGSHAATVEDLRSKIAAMPNLSALASAVTRVFTVSSTVPGTAFTLSSATVRNTISPVVLQNNVQAVNQTSRFVVAPTLIAGDTVSISIGTGTVSQVFTTSDSATLAALTATLDARSDVSATLDVPTRTVTLVSQASGGTFTLWGVSVTSAAFSSSAVTANVPDTRASSTVTVVSVPVAPATLAVGDCTITFSGGISIDASSSNCSDNAAEIDTDTVSSQETLAQLLRGISGYSYSGGVTLAISGSGNQAVFTRSTAQVGTGTLVVTPSSADFTAVSNVPSVAVAQVSTISLPRTLVSGDTFGFAIDSVTYTQNVTSVPATDFATFVANVSALPDVDVVGNFASGSFTVTATTPGTAFTLSGGTISHAASSQTVVSAVAAVAQKDSFTLPASPVSGDSITVIVDGTSVTQGFVTDAAATLSGLVAQINGIGSVVATLSGSTTVVLDAAVPGTAFTVGSVQVNNSTASVNVTPNVAAVAQVSTLTVPFTPVSGDAFAVSIGTGTASQSFVTDVATTLSLLNSSVDALGTVNSSVDTASGTFTFQSRTPGVPFTAALVATGAMFTSSGLIANEVDIAQVDVLSVNRLFATGDSLSVSVAGSGSTIPFSIDSDTTASALRSWIDSLPEVSASMSGSGGSYSFTVTSATPGTPFTGAVLTVNTVTPAVNTVANVFPEAQIDSITVPRSLVAGDVLSVTLSGAAATTVTYSGSEAETLSGLTAALDALSEVSATLSGSTVTVTAAVPGVPFALSALDLTGTVPTTVTINNVVPVTQVVTATLPGLVAGDTVSTTLNGTSVSTPFAASEAATLAAFAVALAASGTVTASFSGSDLTVSSTTPGTPFTLGNVTVTNVTSATVNVTYVPPVAQTVVFDASSTDEGWTFRTTLNGTNYDYLSGSGDTDSTVESALASMILADTGAVLVTTGATNFTLTAAVAGVPFTFSATAVDITAPIVTTPTAAAQTLKSGDVSTSTVASNEDGMVYAVASGTLVSTPADITAAIGAGTAFSISPAVRNVAYAVTVPVGPVDGAYDFVAVDTSGNVSNRMLGWLTIDNTPPLLVLGTPSGQTVHAVSMTVTGVTDPLSTVTVTGAVTLTGSADVSGNFSIVLPLVADSLNAFSFSVTDAVGNSTVRAFSVTEDGIGPAIVANFSGTTYASLASVSLTGQTEAGLTVTVVETVSGTVASVTADGLGNYSAVLPLRLNASNGFTVTATDSAGNTGSVSFTVVQDNVDPIVVLSALPAVVDANSILVSGTTDSNVAVTVSDGTTSAGIASDGSGAFSVSMALVQNATNVFSVTATDLSGRTGTASVSTVEDSVANTLLVSTLPVTVNAANLTVTGTTKPDISVTASGGAATLTGVSNALGVWNFSVPLIQDSVNNLTFTSVDALGNTASGTLAVTEDSINPTVTLSTANSTTYALTVPVAGTTEPFATVTVTGGSGSATVVADALGAFSANVDLNSGVANALTVTATDAAGNSGTANVTVTHDGVVVFLNLSQSGSYVTAAGNFTVSGGTKPGIAVSVSGGAATLTGVSDGSGAFSFSVPLNLNAVNTLTVTATDATLTAATGSVAVTHDSIAPAIVFGTVPAATNALTLTITGTTDPNAVLSIVGLSGSTFTGSADALGGFSVTFPLVANAVNPFDFTATDAAGNSGTGSVSVTQDANVPTISLFAVTSAVLGGSASASYSFSTNEASTGTLYVGTGANVAATLIVTVSTFGLSHTGTVLGLSQGTLYYVYSTAADTAGNLSQIAVSSFTTASVAAPSGGGSTGGGGGGGGGGFGSTLSDSCPNGDYSASYYDGTCGTKPSSSTSASGATVSAPKPPVSKPTVSKPSTPSKTPVTPGKTPVTPTTPVSVVDNGNEDFVPTPNAPSNSDAPTVGTPGVGTSATPGTQGSQNRKNDASAEMTDASLIPGFVSKKYVMVDHTAIVRFTPSFASKPITYLPRNYPITVLAFGKNWSKVKFDNGHTGYVRSVFLRDETARDRNRNDPYLFIRTLTADRLVDRRSIRVKHSLFVRTNPDLNSKIKTWIYAGDVAFILDQMGEWSEVRTKMGIGYVKTKYLQK